MTHNDETPEHEGLKFFGKMNASISHEIRNTLAVINENAGLIKDLISMSEKGHPLDLQRIGVRVEKVLEQVKRTDGIVENMNRFAHSIDNNFMKFNACEYVEFVIRLSERFASMRGVAVKSELQPGPLEITAFPFLFENIIYLCIDEAMQYPKEDNTISISAQKKDDRIRFEFSGVSSRDMIENNLLTGSPGIFKKLDAQIICKKGTDSFILDMPVTPGAQQ